MNQKQLYYFLEVYHCRNIQTAADKLYMTHQGLSRVIRSLEEELGQTLFIRSNRGIEPTDFATTLVPHVNRLLDCYATIQGIHTMESKEKAVVTVCALDHLLGALGAEFVVDFAAANPDITLSVVDTTDEIALDSVFNGTCDFAMVNGPVDNTRYTAWPLFFSRYAFRMHKDDPLAKKESLRVTDFNGRKLIGKGRAYRCFRGAINKYIMEAGLDVDIPLETGDEKLLMELADKGFAIAVTYDFSAHSYCGGNSLIRYLEDERMGQTIYLLEKANTIPTNAARAFRRFLTNWLCERSMEG